MAVSHVINFMDANTAAAIVADEHETMWQMTPVTRPGEPPQTDVAVQVRSFGRQGKSSYEISIRHNRFALTRVKIRCNGGLPFTVINMRPYLTTNAAAASVGLPGDGEYFEDFSFSLGTQDNEAEFHYHCPRGLPIRDGVLRILDKEKSKRKALIFGFRLLVDVEYENKTRRTFEFAGPRHFLLIRGNYSLPSREPEPPKPRPMKRTPRVFSEPSSSASMEGGSDDGPLQPLAPPASQRPQLEDLTRCAEEAALEPLMLEVQERSQRPSGSKRRRSMREEEAAQCLLSSLWGATPAAGGLLSS